MIGRRLNPLAPVGRAFETVWELLHGYRPKYAGFADLLPYDVPVAPGVIGQKDGSLLAGAYFIGPDMESATDEELEALSYHVNEAFLRLGSNWVIHVDAVRYDASSYPVRRWWPDRTSWLIDEERRRMLTAAGAQYDSIYAVTLTYFPPPGTQERMRGFLFDDASAPDRRGLAMRALDEYLGIVDSFYDRLRGGGVSCHPMDLDELTAYLHRAITGLPHPVRIPRGLVPDKGEIPDLRIFLDTLLGSKDLVGGAKPMIGDQHLRVISITGLPAGSAPGMLDILNRLDSGYRWSTRFLPLDKVDAIREVKKLRRAHKAKEKDVMGVISDTLSRRGPGPPTNPDAVQKVSELRDVIGRIEGGNVRAGYYSVRIVLYNPDEARIVQEAARISSALGQMGYASRIETTNAVPAYLGTLPGVASMDLRRSLFLSDNLADLLPMTSVWPGLVENRHLGGPSLLYTITRSATPFRVNIHVEDVGHTLVIGPTGRGKTVLLMLLAAQWLKYQNSQVFLFDKGYGALKLTAAVGGVHYDIAGPGQSLGLCPLQRIHESEEELLWAAEWIAETAALHLTEPLGPDDHVRIREGLAALANGPDRSLSHFISKVQSPAVKAALSFYQSRGAEISLLDAEKDELSDNPFVCFEMGNVMTLGDRWIVPVLTYLFRAVERRLSGQPTLVVLDEAWAFLRHPLFAQKIREWLKVLRKYNASVIFSTQSLSDVMESSISSAILESVRTKIFLSNPAAVEEGSSALYQRLGLNRRQIEIIAHAPNYSYYYVSELGRRLFELNLGEVQMAFLAGASPEATKKVRDYLAGPDADKWPYLYLKELGLADWAELWRTMYAHQGEGTP
ncbi:MAG: VirB4 family type IV secretion/conjugal transfer ATPase [Leptospirales bacterium]